MGKRNISSALTPLDSIVRVETPEGVELELRTAGPLPRAFAWLIDISIRGAIHLFLFAVLLTLDRLGYGLFLITLFALEWFYPVLFEVYFGGATPGKRAMGLQVLHDDGTPVALPAWICVPVWTRRSPSSRGRLN